ncbi:MAG: type IV pilus modification PilV family protein [Nitriliruptorales bacterium]
MRITTVRARRKRLDEEDGLSLVEILMAMTILSVVLLGVATTAVSSVASLRISRERQQATAAASAAIEQARSYGYRDIAHPVGEVDASDPYVTGTDPYYFDHDGDGSDAEELITAAGGQVTPYLTTSADGRLTTRVFVTWYDDPATTAVSRDARRITAVTTWSDAGGPEREVRESTIVAEADRGLAAPNFDISPESLEQVYIETPLCLSHLLRNLGEKDSYDWLLHNHGGSPRTLNADGYTFSANGWDAQAWLGDPEYTTDGSGNTIPDAASANLFKESDSPGDGRPDSPRTLAPGETETFGVCYTPKNEGAENHNKPNLKVQVRSSFDQGVQGEVFHTLVKVSPAVQLYLHDADNTQSHDRTLGVPYAMNPTVPSQTDADGNAIDVLFDYDTNQDPGDLPGLYLHRNESGLLTEHTGIWTYNGFEEGVEIDGGTLTIHSSWDDAILGTAATSPTLSYGFALDLVSGTGEVLETILTSPSSVSYGHGTSGWAQIIVSFDIVDGGGNPTAVEFDTGQEHLRLRLWCTTPTNGEQCHLASDTNTYRSNLVVDTT